jgi:hypothetical protein
MRTASGSHCCPNKPGVVVLARVTEPREIAIDPLYRFKILGSIRRLRGSNHGHAWFQQVRPVSM